jgi:hypothetical protein
MQVSGKAKQVFKYVEVLSRYKGNTTLKDLSRNNKALKLDFKS